MDVMRWSRHTFWILRGGYLIPWLLYRRSIDVCNLYIYIYIYNLYNRYTVNPLTFFQYIQIKRSDDMMLIYIIYDLIFQLWFWCYLPYLFHTVDVSCAPAPVLLWSFIKPLSMNIYCDYQGFMMVSSVASPGMKANPALYVLRERIRKGLQLYSSEPTELLGKKSWWPSDWWDGDLSKIYILRSWWDGDFFLQLLVISLIWVFDFCWVNGLHCMDIIHWDEIRSSDKRNKNRNKVT